MSMYPLKVSCPDVTKLALYWDKDDNYGCFVRLVDHGGLCAGEDDIYTLSKNITEGSTVFLVIVVYTSGDTEGHNYSHKYIDVAITTTDLEEVKAMAKAVHKDNTSHESREVESIYADPKYTDVFICQPEWKGYLEHLESVEIHQFTVASTKESPVCESETPIKFVKH